MVALLIRSNTDGACWRVWPDAEPIQAGAIHEIGSYFFELVDTESASEANLFVDDIPLEALRPTVPRSARWRWSPGFHAGIVEAELRIPGQNPKRFEVVTDPDQRKLTRENFDVMLREILDDTLALFSIGGFRRTIAKGSGGKPPPIARLEFLRSRIEELETVALAIARSPRRILRANEVELPYHRAKRATGTEVLRSFRSGRILRELRRPSSLPDELKSFLPQKIRLRQRQTSLDLPEHRQMAACMRSWASWLANAADQLESKRIGDDPELRQGAANWVRRCRALSRRLNVLCSSSPFMDAGDAVARLTLSSIFRNDPAYRRFYRLWQDINRGIAAVFGDFLSLPLARTFELYELWCFLRLVRAGAEEFGPSGVDLRDLFLIGPAGSVTIAARAVTVPVGSGWKLCFQRQYKEFWTETDGRGSYSRTMTPDIVAAHRSPDSSADDKVIVLDAKYRIDQGINDAIGSIHMYRDALVCEASTGTIEGVVTAAYLLAPHVPSLSENYRGTPMPARLFHPTYRAGFRFGAVTLRPGMSLAEIAAALRQIVSDAMA